MTNEALALAIKQGKTEYIEVLWEQVYKLIDYQAGHVLNSFPDSYRQLREDMINESYFAMIKAIEYYKPEKGLKFSTYLCKCLYTSFQNVLYGGKTERAKNEPLNAAISLENTIDDAEDLTLMETLLDEEAEAAYWDIEDAEYYADLNKMLCKVADSIPSKQGGEMVQYMLKYDCTPREAAEVMNLDAKQQSRFYKTALSQMYDYIRRNVIKRQFELIGFYDYEKYTGTGIFSYRNNQNTSSVEKAVIKKVDTELRNKRLLRVLSRR